MGYKNGWTPTESRLTQGKLEELVRTISPGDELHYLDKEEHLKRGVAKTVLPHVVLLENGTAVGYFDVWALNKWIEENSGGGVTHAYH